MDDHGIAAIYDCQAQEGRRKGRKEGKLDRKEKRKVGREGGKKERKGNCCCKLVEGALTGSQYTWIPFSSLRHMIKSFSQYP